MQGSQIRALCAIPQHQPQILNIAKQSLFSPLVSFEPLNFEFFALSQAWSYLTSFLTLLTIPLAVFFSFVTVVFTLEGDATNLSLCVAVADKP